MALLIAIALFVAQAINLALVLRDRSQFRVAQIARPVAVRIADALDREAQGGRPLRADRGRVRLMSADVIAPTLEKRDDIAQEVAAQLKELGVKAGRIDTGVRGWTSADEGVVDRRRARDGRGGEARRPGGRDDDHPPQVLLIAVEQPGRGWLTVTMPWGGGTSYIFWRLFAQTLILYGVVLLPVLWIARRISRPLRALTAAARDFSPATAAEPLVEGGPSDLRALTAAFNALRLRVTAMLDEKDRMLGAIGHDLRTPLAALRVRVESVDDDGDRARMIDTINEMNRTLDDILSLARLGRPSEFVTETDLSALVDAVVDDFRDLGDPVEFAETPRVLLRLRPTLMRRGVRNLIENAVKYGGGAEVMLTNSPESATIVVADNGPGIPPDRLSEVFDAFTRLETSRNRETGGSGLGLALTRAIVEDAGGHITLANRATGGLAATITLPRSA